MRAMNSAATIAECLFGTCCYRHSHWHYYCQAISY